MPKRNSFFKELVHEAQAGNDTWEGDPAACLLALLDSEVLVLLVFVDQVSGP